MFNTASAQNLGSAVYQTFVELPYRAATTPRQVELAVNPGPDVTVDRNANGHATEERSHPVEPVSDDFFKLFTSKDSVSSLLAQDPSMSPGQAWDKLYGHHDGRPRHPHFVHHVGKHEPSEDLLKKTTQCGRWGPTQPSDLFLRMYHDAITSLEEKPARAMVSPSLMGSCGVLPLTVISTIPDIVRHMANCIVRADQEVFLATNFWQNSIASKYITDAMKELSRRAGVKGTKIVMKMIYDRGSPKQLVEPHYIVPVKEYTGSKVGIPAPEEIPNIELQVMNYHHPLLGTFHAKYAVIDRKIAIVQSNNIQDNENLEMMVHLEGPIVDSIYDMALISWHKHLNPPLPSYNVPEFTEAHADVAGPVGSTHGHPAVVDSAKVRPRDAYDHDVGNVKPGIINGGESTLQESHDRNRTDFATGSTLTESSVPDEKATSRTGRQHNPKANTINGPDQSTTDFPGDGTPATDQVPLSTDAADSLPEHTTDDHHWDTDIAGEILRVQAAVTGKGGETTMQAVNRHLNHSVNPGFPHDAPECAPEDEMTPYIAHPAHEPFPMAMVCRPPHGPPNHKSATTPQNAAWLSALRNAQHDVFIQSPTLNAAPLLPAIAEACERGVHVHCYVCLGYNDAGELLPLQGGHNEAVAHRLLLSLSAAARAHLHYYWYVAKDQTRPVAKARARACHIKLLVADGRVGVVGSGNQDTQSWFHSQEVNVMVDSAAVCGAWVAALRRNQNTHLHGALDGATGVWVDAAGEQVAGAIGVDAGRWAWTRGVVGALDRVRGVGGF